MRLVRYSVAASLDGYIAGPDGEFDWIPSDPAVDFAALFADVDIVLLGRKSYELTAGSGTPPWRAGTRVYVFSRSLDAADLPGATVSRNPSRTVETLRVEPGEGEIWLFGGGELFRELAASGLVDRVEVTVVPVLLGRGIPLIAPGAGRLDLRLEDLRRYPSGMVTLNYTFERPRPPADRPSRSGVAQ